MAASQIVISFIGLGRPKNALSIGIRFIHLAETQPRAELRDLLEPEKVAVDVS